MLLYQRMLIKDIQIQGIKESTIDESLKEKVLLDMYYKCSIQTTESECDLICCKYKNECYKMRKEDMEEYMKVVNENGNITDQEGKCDILSGEAPEASRYNITCCKECYRFHICLRAANKEKE